MAGDLLVRSVRLVPVARPAPVGPVDVRVEAGVVTGVGRSLVPAGDAEVIDGDGRWLIPGLWDHHVHIDQWASSFARLDCSAARSVEDAQAIVRTRLADQASGEGAVVGFGHRPLAWPRPPRTADLDALTTERPVVLVSGDAHHGWLNSAGHRALGVEPGEGVICEREWFRLYARLGSLRPEDPREARADALRAAAALGVVGITDLEFGDGVERWGTPTPGLDALHVRVGIYPDELPLAIERGLRTGETLVEGVATMGPLKVITDGSLGTRTAHCCEPYADATEGAGPYGMQNVSPDVLGRLLRRATMGGIEVALHAIGDAALTIALDAVEATGARGGIEHVQLARSEDLERMARLGVRASVQPAHLLDDRDVTMRCWPDRSGRVYAFRAMLDAGVRVVLGSDAPVAPLDPWLSIAAAVHRSADERPPWHPEQALTVAEALVASTDGQGTVSVGSRGDLVLLDADPLAAPTAGAGDGEPGDPAAHAAYLRRMPVAATVRSGRLTHRRGL